MVTTPRPSMTLRWKLIRTRTRSPWALMLAVASCVAPTSSPDGRTPVSACRLLPHERFAADGPESHLGQGPALGREAHREPQCESPPATYQSTAAPRKAELGEYLRRCLDRSGTVGNGDGRGRIRDAHLQHP